MNKNFSISIGAFFLLQPTVFGLPELPALPEVPQFQEAAPIAAPKKTAPPLPPLGGVEENAVTPPAPAPVRPVVREAAAAPAPQEEPAPATALPPLGGHTALPPLGAESTAEAKTEASSETANTETRVTSDGEGEAEAGTPAAKPVPENVGVASTAANGCYYVVQKNDSLSKVLYNLGIYPIWGTLGAVTETSGRNPDGVLQRGNLIYPGARIRLPGKSVGPNEECLAVRGGQFAPGSQAANEEAAEQAIRYGQYTPSCRDLERFASQHRVTESRRYLTHLTAICFYENRELGKAQALWTKLGLEPLSSSLRFRVKYNLALILCQTERSKDGYEYLREAAQHPLEIELEWTRREFLRLTTYCTGKIGGKDMQKTALNHVAEHAGSQAVRLDAKRALAELQAPAIRDLASAPNTEASVESPTELSRYYLGTALGHQEPGNGLASGSLFFAFANWNPRFTRFGPIDIEGLVGVMAMKFGDRSLLAAAEVGGLLGVQVNERLSLQGGLTLRRWLVEGESTFLGLYTSLNWRLSDSPQGLRLMTAYVPAFRDGGTIHEVRIGLGFGD